MLWLSGQGVTRGKGFTDAGFGNIHRGGTSGYRCYPARGCRYSPEEIQDKHPHHSRAGYICSALYGTSAERLIWAIMVPVGHKTIELYHFKLLNKNSRLLPAVLK